MGQHCGSSQLQQHDFARPGRRSLSTTDGGKEMPTEPRPPSTVRIVVVVVALFVAVIAALLGLGELFERLLG